MPMKKFYVKAPNPVSGKHWELEFTKGVAQTDDEIIAGKYAARGYDVQEVFTPAAPAPEDDKAGAPPAPAQPEPSAEPEPKSSAVPAEDDKAKKSGKKE